jgi:hypothetical protein
MWKVASMLSNMESSPSRPTAAEASAALADAEASRTTLAHGIETPSWFFLSMGAAIAAQIATTAVGLGDGNPWVLEAGLAIFFAVAAVQLVRFRRLNGVWLGGFASRVVLGTGALASVSYVIALAAAIWAAYDARWWVSTLWSIAGGGAYALSGRRWMRAYRAQPVAAVAGLVLLLING